MGYVNLSANLVSIRARERSPSIDGLRLLIAESRAAELQDNCALPPRAPHIDAGWRKAQLCGPQASLKSCRPLTLKKLGAATGVRFGIMGLEFTANLGDFTGECWSIPKTRDCMAEGEGFEPSSPFRG